MSSPGANSPSSLISPELCLVDPELAAWARVWPADRPLDRRPPRSAPAQPRRIDADRRDAASIRFGVREPALSFARSALAVAVVVGALTFPEIAATPSTSRRSLPVSPGGHPVSAVRSVAAPPSRSVHHRLPRRRIAEPPHTPAATPVPAVATTRVPPRPRTRATVRKQAARPGLVAPRRAEASPARSKPAGAAAAPAVLRWRAAAGARAYDVILWRDGKRVLDLWPKQARVALPRHWRHGGTTFSLGSGEVMWFVYPVFSTPTGTRFGPLLRSGRLRT